MAYPRLGGQGRGVTGEPRAGDQQVQWREPEIIEPTRPEADAGLGPVELDAGQLASGFGLLLGFLRDGPEAFEISDGAEGLPVRQTQTPGELVALVPSVAYAV